jgi:hypothetical protein
MPIPTDHWLDARILEMKTNNPPATKITSSVLYVIRKLSVHLSNFAAKSVKTSLVLRRVKIVLSVASGMILIVAKRAP